MSNLENISDAGKKKIKFYSAAIYLFNKGKSHPQIIELLSGLGMDPVALDSIVSKAMREDWDKLYEKARILFGESKTYSEVVEEISRKEEDPEIVKVICADWYAMKTLYIESIVEAPGNIREGMQWVIITGLAIPVTFWAGLSWFSKGIWIAAFVSSVIQWLMGLQQRKLANKINAMFRINES